MGRARTALLCAAAATALLTVHAFVVPTTGPSVAPRHAPASVAASASAGTSSFARSWTFAAGSIAIGAHLGLLVAAARGGRTARRAEEEEGGDAKAPVAKKAAKDGEAKAAKKAAKKDPPAKLVSASDERLFEKVFFEYTKEYLKGPMYWTYEKLQGRYPADIGEPEYKNGKYQLRGKFSAISSNELAAMSMLFFGIGLYGTLMFNFYDDQWVAVDQGRPFNPWYIIEAQFLLPSWFLHIMCYVQKKNGK